MLSLKPKSLFVQNVLNRLKQATTFWLFRLMIGITIASIAVIPVLQLTVENLPKSVWSIVWVLLIAIVFVYLVTLVNGTWDEQKRRIQVDPLVILMMIIVITAGCAAYCQDILFNEGEIPYITYLAIAVIILLATLFTNIAEKRMDEM